MGADLVWVVVGFFLLTVAADRLVVAAARLASVWGLSPILIGAVVVGLGTSLPEMLVSGLAAGRPGGLDMAMGNIVGSNIANLGLVLGASVLLSPIDRPRTVLMREGAMVLAATVMLSGLSWDGALRRPEGVVLGAGLIVALGSMIRWSRIGAASGVPEVEEWIAGQAVRPLREAVFGLGSLGLTLAGAQILVTGARGVATDLGISEAIIGITLVAVGTSLPELATAIAAARRRKNEIVLGNVLGSNLFNALAVGGVTGAVGDGPFTASFDRPLLAMLAITILTGVLALTGHDRLARFEGFVLLLSYPALMAIL